MLLLWVLSLVVVVFVLFVIGDADVDTAIAFY